MPVTRYVKVNGTDLGPNGTAIVMDMDIDVAGRNKVGMGRLRLRYLESETYTFKRGQKVEIYHSGGAAGFGYLGGVVSNVNRKILKRASPTYVFTELQVQDLNVALDTVVRAAGTTATIAAGTLATQVTDLFVGLQKNGLGSVAWEFDTTTYVDNLTGATVLPAFTVHGKSLRDGMDTIMANAFAANSALRPGYHLALMSDGAGGVAPAVLVYDKAAVSSPQFVLATNADTGAGEYPIYELADDVNGNLLTTYQQAFYGDPPSAVLSYGNTTAQAAYPNLFVNNGGTGSTGHWWDTPVSITDAASQSAAQSKLDRTVKSKEYPIQTLTVTVDNIDIMPGDVATVRIPELGISSNFVAVEVKIKFLAKEGLTYTRVTITFGRRKRALGDTGEDEEAAPPDQEIEPRVLDAPTWVSAYTTGVDPQGRGWITATVNAVTGARWYRYYGQNTPSGPIYWIEDKESTSITLRDLPLPSTRYLYASALDYARREGVLSSSKTVTVSPLPERKPPAPGWDAYHPDDATVRGLAADAGSTSAIAWDTAVLYDGKTSLKITLSAGETHTFLLGNKYAAVAGEVVTVGAARRVTTFSTIKPHLKVRWYDSADAAIGSDTTVFDATATAAFVYTEAKCTAPANTRYFRVLVGAAHNSSTGAAYFSYPEIKREITPKDLPTTLNLESTIVLNSTSGGTIRIKSGGGNKISMYDEDDAEFGGMIASGRQATNTAEFEIRAPQGEIVFNALQGVTIRGSSFFAEDITSSDHISAVTLATSGKAAIGTTVGTEHLIVAGDERVTGTLYVGTTDTNLYRAAADKLKTDDSLVVAVRAGIGGDTDSTYALKVTGKGHFTSDLTVDASGGSTGTPRVLGLTSLGTARFQFGDEWNSIQTSNGYRLQMQAYHGIEIWGARSTTGSSLTFASGGGSGDPGLRIYGSQSGTKVAAIRGASSQTANLLDFENSAGTVLSGINASGEFVFGGNKVLGARQTGWSTPTGTLYRGGLSDLSAQVNFNRAIMALITDLITQGIIGA